MTIAINTVRHKVAALAIGRVALVVTAFCVATRAFADRTVSSDYTLTADEDWTGDGKITIGSGVTVNLAGHTLTVAGLDGEGSIANSVNFTNLATDTLKASCSAGITSVDSAATAGRAFEDVNRVIVQKTKSGNTYWPFSVTYDFGEATVINTYGITASSDNSYYDVRGPGEWTLYGSNDGENWTGLGDTQTATASDWTSVGKGGTKNFDLDNSTAYQYYKITISKSASPSASQGGYIEFKQIQYGYKPVGTVVVSGTAPDVSGLTISGGVTFTLAGDITLAADCDLRGLGTNLDVATDAVIDLNGHKLYARASAFANACTVKGAVIDHADDLTTTDSSKVSSTTTFYSSTTAANLFNNNYERTTDSARRIIVATNNLPVVVTYDFGEGTVVDSYKLYWGPFGSDSSVANSRGRSPKAWRFEGSNDGFSWTPLDSRNSETWTNAQETRTYTFANTTPYRYYRITVLENQGTSAYLEMVQLEYMNLASGRGELHVVSSASEGTHTLTNLSLFGNLRLFIEGDGTVAMAKTNQTYIGGTELCGGRVEVGAAGVFGGRGADVVVNGDGSGEAKAASALLDFNGYATGGIVYKYMLNGGTIIDCGDGAVQELVLTADSYMKALDKAYLNGHVDIDGYELRIRAASGKQFVLKNATLENGSVWRNTNNGWLAIAGTVIATNNVTFTQDGPVDVTGDGWFSVMDYTQNYNNDGYNKGAHDIDVYGKYKPSAGGLFHGAVMHDGSIIDLSGVTALPLSVIAPWSGSNATGTKTLHFAEGAKVGVVLGSRKVEPSTPIISWNAETAPDASVKFASADAERAFSLEVKDDGLYYHGGGLIIIFK